MPTCLWFYLRYKIRKIIQSSVLSFLSVLKVANFLLPSPCSVFLVLLGRKPAVRIFSTNYAKFFCLFLWLCINVLRNVGECCESVPLDCTGSYGSISINITKILARVVQVDAFIISLYVGYICIVMVVGCWFSSKFCISCVELEY